MRKGLRLKRGSSDELGSGVEGEMCLYVDRLKARRHNIFARNGGYCGR